MCMCPTTIIIFYFFEYQNHYYGLSVFKNDNKTRLWDVFGWIFGHVSLLKLEKDVEDDNRYSVLQIGIVSSRNYFD